MRTLVPGNRTPSVDARDGRDVPCPGSARHAARTALWAVAAACGIALLSPAVSALAADARVREVHVTQSIQTLTGNDVPLVADRSTAVRAVIDEVGGDVAGVFASAHITVDG